MQTGHATYKLELFAVPSGDRLVVNASDYAPSAGPGAGEPVDPSHIVWSSWTSVLGPEMEGVWPTAERTQQADVNCADVCKNAAAVVTGDDFGFVKLFRFPALESNVHDLLYWTVLYKVLHWQVLDFETLPLKFKAGQ